MGIRYNSANVQVLLDGVSLNDCLSDRPVSYRRIPREPVSQWRQPDGYVIYNNGTWEYKPYTPMETVSYELVIEKEKYIWED